MVFHLQPAAVQRGLAQSQRWFDQQWESGFQSFQILWHVCVCVTAWGFSQVQKCVRAARRLSYWSLRLAVWSDYDSESARLSVCVLQSFTLLPIILALTHQHHQPIPKRLDTSLPRHSEDNADHIASSKSHIIILSNWFPSPVTDHIGCSFKWPSQFQHQKLRKHCLQWELPAEREIFLLVWK